MLIDGELDALMIALPPQGFYEPDSPIVRVIPDYRVAERAYYERTGLYPAHHIVGIRREIFERHPWVAQSLFDAFERSKSIWQGRRRLAETTPWLLAEIEAATALMGTLDWQPNGVEPNRAMTAALCDELYAQGLIDQPLDPETVFAEFEQAAPDALASLSALHEGP
jgi:4,5-dihydroxyphthalate decarboxylase